MKLTLLTFAALVSCSIGAKHRRPLGLWAQPLPGNGRIAGGWNAPPGVATYTASIRLNNNIHFCGGAIINDRWVLTSAFCVAYATPSDIKIIVGTHLLDQGGDTYMLDHVIWHDYDIDTGLNDIALIKTSKKIVFSYFVSAVSLEDGMVEHGTMVTLTGWGESVRSITYSNHLQLIHLTAITNDYCRALLDGITIFDTNICTLGLADHGLRFGDWGAPLVAGGIVLGIVSVGNDQSTESGNEDLIIPTIYTRVSEYRTWINKIEIENE